MKKKKKKITPSIIENYLGVCPKCGAKLKVSMGKLKGKTCLGAKCVKCDYFG